MAGGQERILRGRIRSVQATKKITRAMELIAASRIVKAQQRVAAAVPYSEQITEVVKDLAAAGGEVRTPLLNGRDSGTKRVCLVVLTADRGLCGGYNTGVLRLAEADLKADIAEGRDYAIVAVGRKAETYLRFRGYKLSGVFSGFTENPTYAHAKAIAERVVEMFMNDEVDAVELVYTRFITAGSQEVVKRPLVPLDRDLIAGGDGKPGSHAEGEATGASYEFEPDPATILETLIPRYIEARTYAALLNAAASEHAFRQRAMKSATDNAEELIKTLSRIMNRARQDSITTEIMEIVSGAEALGSDKSATVRYIDLDDGFGARQSGGTTDRVSTLAAVPVAASAAVPSSVPSSVATLEADDLEGEIDGIGPVIVRRLAQIGVTTFRQIASWTADEIERVGAELEFKGRIEREDWVGQAKRAHAVKYGEQI